jgi:hypothetical protein
MEARCGRNASWLALAPVAGILLITLVTQGVLKPLFGCREGGGGEFSFTCPSKVVELTAVITVPAGIILYFVCRRRARSRAAA